MIKGRRSIFFGLTISVVISLAVGMTTPLAAQFVVPSDLVKCLEEGLASNYELQIVKGVEQQASNSASLLNSGVLPTLSIDGDYNIDTDQVNAKITDGSKTSYDQTDHYVTAGLGVSWTIFKGFEIRTSYERLRELESQSKVETRIAIEDYIANLTAEYYNYIQQQSRLQNLNKAVELSKERLRIVRARYMVGNFSRLDYQQANVDFNVDSADYLKQREVFKSSAIKLNELMAKENTNSPVMIQDTVISVDLSLDYKDIQYAMESNNAEILHAGYNTSISKLDYKRVLARNYPYATLSAEYGVIHNKYGYSTTRTNNRLGVDATVSVGFTIFDGQRRTSRQNASIAIKNAELNESDVALKLGSELNNLWQAYVNNLGLLHLEKSSLGAAQENYEIAMERYMLGNLSGIEMREAQKSLLDAEDRILSATYNTKICEISLMQISGQIMKYLSY